MTFQSSRDDIGIDNSVAKSGAPTAPSFQNVSNYYENDTNGSYSNSSHFLSNGSTQTQFLVAGANNSFWRWEYTFALVFGTGFTFVFIVAVLCLLKRYWRKIKPSSQPSIYCVQDGVFSDNLSLNFIDNPADFARDPKEDDFSDEAFMASLEQAIRRRCYQAALNNNGSGSSSTRCNSAATDITTASGSRQSFYNDASNAGGGNGQQLLNSTCYRNQALSSSDISTTSVIIHAASDKEAARKARRPAKRRAPPAPPLQSQDSVTSTSSANAIAAH